MFPTHDFGEIHVTGKDVKLIGFEGVKQGQRQNEIPGFFFSFGEFLFRGSGSFHAEYNAAQWWAAGEIVFLLRPRLQLS